MRRPFIRVIVSTVLLLANDVAAGMVSDVNSVTDTALIACVKANHVTADNALGVYIKQCEPEIKASLAECRAYGKSADVCNWALLSFMNGADGK